MKHFESIPIGSAFGWVELASGEVRTLAPCEALALTVGAVDGRVIIQFSAPIHRIGLPPDTARLVAERLVENAALVDEVNEAIKGTDE